MAQSYRSGLHQALCLTTKKSMARTANERLAGRSALFPSPPARAANLGSRGNARLKNASKAEEMPLGRRRFEDDACPDSRAYSQCEERRLCMANPGFSVRVFN